MKLSPCGQRGTDAWQGPVRDLIDVLMDGQTYKISIWVKLELTDSSYVKMTIQQADATGTHYSVLNEATAYGDRWTKLSGTFTPDITGYLEGMNLYVEGPKTGVNFYVDDLEIEWSPLGK